jgi:hypothetical protein
MLVVPAAVVREVTAEKEEISLIASVLLNVY